MTYTGGGVQAIITASTTITQTGSNLSFGNMNVTSPVSLVFGMGAATLTSNTFDGTNTYSSSGCGTVTNHYRGYFSSDGGIMNMTMTLTGSQRNCGDTDIRGEMRR